MFRKVFVLFRRITKLFRSFIWPNISSAHQKFFGGPYRTSSPTLLCQLELIVCREFPFPGKREYLEISWKFSRIQNSLYLQIFQNLVKMKWDYFGKGKQSFAEFFSHLNSKNLDFDFSRETEFWGICEKLVKMK